MVIGYICGTLDKHALSADKRARRRAHTRRPRLVRQAAWQQRQHRSKAESRNTHNGEKQISDMGRALYKVQW